MKEHPNIVRLVDCCFSEFDESNWRKGEWYFVYEYVNGGDLFDLIHKYGKDGFGESIARFFFK